MKDKKMVPVVLLNLLGVLFGIFANLFVGAKGGSASSLVSAWLTVAALLASLIYLFMGYGKNAALCFKIYLYAYALAGLFAVADVSVAGRFTVIIAAALFGLVLVLAMSTDLGRMKSFCVCVLNVALTVIFLICSIKTGAVGVIRAILLGILSLLTVLMVMGKYDNKAKRKTR